MGYNLLKVILLVGISLLILSGCHMFLEFEEDDYLPPPRITMENWGEEIRVTFSDDEEWRENISSVRMFLIFENLQEEKETIAWQFSPDFEVGEGEIIVEKPELEDRRDTPLHFIPPYYWDEKDIPFFLVEVLSRGYKHSPAVFPLETDLAGKELLRALFCPEY